MSFLSRTRRPRPFLRFSRDDYEQQIRALEVQRDRAVGEKRALRDGVASWLEARAGGYDEDAQHLDRLHAVGDPLTALQRRAIACELRQAAVDFEEGVR